MSVRRFTHDEGLVLYEDTDGGDFEVDIPDDLYRRWQDARAAAFRAEEEICALYDTQQPPWTQPPPLPAPVRAEPTAPAPIPRTLDEYRQAAS